MEPDFYSGYEPQSIALGVQVYTAKMHARAKAKRKAQRIARRANRRR